MLVPLPVPLILLVSYSQQTGSIIREIVAKDFTKARAKFCPH